MKTSKIMKALLVFGMSMVTATAVIGFTACGDDHDHVDEDKDGKCDICEIVMTTDDSQEENKGGDDEGEEKPAPKTTVTAEEWKEILESVNNYTLTQSSEAGDDYDMLIQVDGDKVAFDDDTVYVKDGEHYYLYYYDSETEKWAKEEIEAEEYNEDAGMFVGIVKSFKDDYKKFTPSNGKYIAASVDKTDTDLDAIVENIEVTFSDGKLVGVKCEIKTEAPKDEEGPNEIFGESTTDEQSEEPTEGTTEEPTEGTTEEPTEDPTEEPTEDPTEEPTEDPTEYITINYEITKVGSTTVPLPKVDGEANVLGTYYTYWFDDDKGGWKYAGGEDIVVKDDGTCVVDGDDATYEIEDSGVVKVNVNGGQIYAKIEDKIMWLFKTAADADDYTKAMGFAYNGTVISTEDKEKVEENTGKGFVTEGGETPGPGIDLGAYVGTYYSYWPGVEEAVWEYGFDIVVNDDGTCLVDGDKKTYVVDENGVVNVDSGSVYVKIEDKIMWLYENIDSIGDYANAMSFAYKGSNEIPADVKLMIEKITGKGFANEDPNPNPPIALSAYGPEPIYTPETIDGIDYIYHHIYLDDVVAKQYDFDDYTATAKIDGVESDYALCQAFSDAEIKDHSYHMRVRVKANRYQTVEITISFMKGGEVVATGIYTRVGDKEISLSDSTLSLTLAEDGSTVTETLTVTLKNVEGSVEWSIDDDSVATVTDNGDGTATVTAVAAGKATITVSVEGATPKTCKVEVLNPGETGKVTQLTARLDQPYNNEYMRFVLEEDMGTMGGDSFDGLRINGTPQTWIERVGPWAGGGIAYNMHVGDITLPSYHVEFIKNNKVVAEFTYTA